jgi:hypothetical protein
VGDDRAGGGAEPAQTSFVMAMIMPISTKTIIALCSQIQVGDTHDSLTCVAPAAGEQRRPMYSQLSCRQCGY